MQTVEFYTVSRSRSSGSAEKAPPPAGQHFWGSRRDPVSAVDVAPLSWEESKTHVNA